jgi:hypothetical protein
MDDIVREDMQRIERFNVKKKDRLLTVNIINRN